MNMQAEKPAENFDPKRLELKPEQLTAIQSNGKPHRDCQSVMQSTVARSKQLVDDLDRLLDAAIRTGDKPAIEKLAEAKATMRLAAIDIKRARRLNKATQVMPFGR